MIPSAILSFFARELRRALACKAIELKKDAIARADRNSPLHDSGH
jgi:hypothetical protein